MNLYYYIFLGVSIVKDALHFFISKNRKTEIGLPRNIKWTTKINESVTLSYFIFQSARN